MKQNKMLAVMLSSVLFGATLVGCGSSNSSKLNVLSTKTVELGDPVILDPAEFLADNSNDINVADITVESDLKTDDFQYTYNQMNQSVTSKGKEFLGLGTYEVTLKYKDQSYPVRLVIKDTTMPEFISPAAVVTVPVGNEDYNFSNVYRTRDKDKVTISINGDYDLTTEGKYPVTVVATVESDLKTDDFQYTYNQMNQSVTSKGKEFLGLGTYEVTLKYKDQSYPVRLVIKDTTMPEFISPAAVVTVPVGNEDYNFSNVYRTRDKDKVTISINGDYDLTTEGKYPVTVVATDASGNTNSLEITIKVVGKNQQISASDQFDNEVPSDH